MPAKFNLETVSELLASVFAKLPVPALLTCERVCKQWSAIMRVAASTQVWKPKLVAGYPEGCLPVLRGRGNWRDVALISYAWGREWQPVDACEPIKVLDCDMGFDRTGNGVVQDVTSCFDALPENVVFMMGSLESGEIIFTTDPDGTSPNVYLDNIFADCRYPTGKSDIDFQAIYLRPNAIVRRPETIARTQVFEDHKTGTKILERPYEPTTIAITICGDHIIQDDTIPGPIGITFPSTTVITSIRNPSFHLEITDCTSICFNETILAYNTREPDNPNPTPTTHIIRISDQKLLGQHTLRETTTLSTKNTITMSRFNLFVHHRDRTSHTSSILVLDFLKVGTKGRKRVKRRKSKMGSHTRNRDTHSL
ncbi:hypothetical protein HDV00_008159 [Rhizophlyctis rosea]|nr:hypothetical protein HDV00_008159 [Rhizophlyctis rosea]